MMNNHTDLRRFRGGAWDLRKVERRKEQAPLAFPDRRNNDRRNTGKAEDLASVGGLLWVDPSQLDE
jgi:hypothetical protein